MGFLVWLIFSVSGGKKPFFRRPGVWMDVKDGIMPMRTVLGGNDSDGEKIYVGRAKIDGAIVPGKVVPAHKTCYMGLDGTEHGASKYQVCFSILQLSSNTVTSLHQVLVRNKCCELVWVPATEGAIPFGALQAGVSKEKEPLFVARSSTFDGATTIGWVYHKIKRYRASLYFVPLQLNPAQGICSCSYGGEEHFMTEYEILVVKYIPL